MNNKYSPSSTRLDYKSYHYAKCYHPATIIFPKLDTCRYLRNDSSVAELQKDTHIISSLPGYTISKVFECTVSSNEDGSILIECPLLQLYSTGDTRAEAIENIEENIVCLFDDLSESNDFSDDWLKIKSDLLSYMHKA